MRPNDAAARKIGVPDRRAPATGSVMSARVDSARPAIASILRISAAAAVSMPE
jgi:hypothetical protein